MFIMSLSKEFYGLFWISVRIEIKDIFLCDYVL